MAGVDIRLLVTGEHACGKEVGIVAAAVGSTLMRPSSHASLISAFVVDEGLAGAAAAPRRVSERSQVRMVCSFGAELDPTLAPVRPSPWRRASPRRRERSARLAEDRVGRRGRRGRPGSRAAASPSPGGTTGRGRKIRRPAGLARGLAESRRDRRLRTRCYSARRGRQGRGAEIAEGGKGRRGREPCSKHDREAGAAPSPDPHP